MKIQWFNICKLFCKSVAEKIICIIWRARREKDGSRLLYFIYLIYFGLLNISWGMKDQQDVLKFRTLNGNRLSLPDGCNKYACVIHTQAEKASANPHLSHLLISFPACFPSLRHLSLQSGRWASCFCSLRTRGVYTQKNQDREKRCRSRAQLWFAAAASNSNQRGPCITDR